MYANGIEKATIPSKSPLTNQDFNARESIRSEGSLSSIITESEKEKREDPGSYEVMEIEFVGAKVSAVVACGDLLDTRNLYGCLYTG